MMYISVWKGGWLSLVYPHLQMTVDEGKQYCQRKVDKLRESLSNVQGVGPRGVVENSANVPGAAGSSRGKEGEG